MGGISTDLRDEFAGNGRFQVLGRLGAGGMGVVYDVFDRDRKARVALKTLRALGGEALLRFKNEFRALSDLHHPNLCSLGELIEDAGQWFFTMELIDGHDLLAWVRPDGQLDPARLRLALAQLSRGLTTLHGAGKVHRDIKPSNVRVTRDGRVVLLDLGLVTDIARAGHARTSSDQVVGTASYMAPEQAQSKVVGAPADWYAVGVVLYEALTGEVPFVGSPLEVLMRKQSELPKPPSVRAPVAEDLDALCMALLRVDPTERAGATAVLAAASPRAFDMAAAAAPVAPIDAAHAHAPHAPPFVGRAWEMGRLEEAFAATRAGGQERDGRPVALFVRGESGVGKSALVRQFADDVAERGAVVLSGRCYERESVPYKALDGVIDALTSYMARIDKAEAAALLPSQTALLAQTFPVLLRVEAVARAPRPSTEVRDPLELRGRVFGAVRELLCRLADRRPLVLVIDDLQWADADSLALLGEILRLPEAPALLLVAIARSDGAGNGGGSRGGGEGVDVDAFQRGLEGDVRTLELGGLPADEARRLVTLLCDARPLGMSVDSIATEARGHPLFIDEMVRHALGQTAPGERPRLRLEEVLWARLCKLEPEQQRIVALVATAGAPLWLETAARAAGDDDFHRFGERVAALRAQRLVRTSGARRQDSIEPYHDRVRAAQRTHLSDGARQALHEALARALEHSGQFEPEAASQHWEAAGQADKAARYAAIAAARATQALAFDRAAALYRRSLALRVPDGAEGRSLKVKLAEALANAGRGVQAGEAYLEARVGAPADEALDLERCAADQFLRAGHLDEGLDVIKSVMSQLDMKLPPPARRALMSLLTRRARLRLRGLGFVERAAASVDARALSRIDACWSMSQALGTVDTIRGADVQTRCLLLSLEAGEPYRIARALTMESAYVATAGGPARERAARLLEAGRTLAERIDHPQRAHAIGWARLAGGFGAFLCGRWAEARTGFAAAETVFREQCSGVTWELETIDLFSLWARYYLGDLAALASLLPSRLQEATTRGDLYGVTNLRARVSHAVHLCGDDPEAAEHEAREAVAGWSHRGFHAQHYYQLFAQAQVDLYRGDAHKAALDVQTRWPELQRSLLLNVQFIALESLHLRARVQLAAARANGAVDERLVRSALADARTLERAHMPWATPLGTLVRAGAAAGAGDLDAAARLLGEATAALDGAGMALYATLARWRRGQLLGGGDGYALVTAANEWLAAQRIREPRRLAAVLLPGFPD